MQRSGSKDTWVLGGTDGTAPFARPAEISLPTQPSLANLPSRVADNLYWLGRYAERVEFNARLVRALLPSLSAEEDFRYSISLETAVRMLVGLRYLPPEVASASLSEQLWSVQRLLSDVVYDRTRIFGLGWNLREMRRVAWHLKERLSPDTWRVLQQIETDFSRSVPTSPSRRYNAQITLLEDAIVSLSAFSGLLMENTTRGDGWRFLEIGRRLERTLQTAELLRSGMAGAPLDEMEAHLQVLLRIADSSITYRTRYLTVLRADLVLELLLLDESNPRSVGFQLAALLEHIEKLPEREIPGRPPLERRQALKALTAVRLAQAADLCQRNGQGRLTALEDLISQISGDMQALSDTLTAQYLSHVKTSPLRSSF